MVLMLSYDEPGTWLSGEGPESDIVISSRIRLARNVTGFPFVNKMEDQAKKDFVSYFLQRISPIIKAYNLQWIDITELSGVDLKLLLERHLISKEIIQGKGSRGLLVNSAESISVMINEEDHLRIQYLASGLQLNKVWQDIDSVDDKIDAAVPYSFSPELGYLTSCPTNIGTGIRISVMLHLPGLSITNQIKKVFQAVSKIGLTVRGLFGEGTEGVGDFFQISNQVTLGISEMDIISKVGGVIPKIISYERLARERLLQESRVLFEDRIWRAYGILKYTHSLCSEESLTLLSLLRLGINIQILKDITIQTINKLFLMCQPSHLQKKENREMESSERDIVRAAYLRKTLQN